MELCWINQHKPFTQKSNIFWKGTPKWLWYRLFLETHHKAYSEIPPEILRYGNTHHILHSPDESHTGIIGLLKKEYAIITEKHIIQGRILNIKVEHKTEKIKYNISAIYLHTNKHLNKEKMTSIVTKWVWVSPSS